MPTLHRPARTETIPGAEDLFPESRKRERPRRFSGAPSLCRRSLSAGTDLYLVNSAGDGRQGSSGDGGSAAHADLRLACDSGIGRRPELVFNCGGYRSR
jgi:hypothetical protein